MTVIERAFALAESGACRNLQELGARLRAEGYAQVAEHLQGLSLRRQLKAMMVKASRSRMDVVGDEEG
ncbi:MAG TPA: hypothetical protein VH331_16335 [Allosphingosinicella sp.]|jgi:hypothetical protein|nr:hypothetical protein [Allosphingosinicella sp.]